MDGQDLLTTLNDVTSREWTHKSPGPAVHNFYAGSYQVTIEARKPKEDHTWRITIENHETGDESAVGPVESENVNAELKSMARTLG